MSQSRQLAAIMFTDIVGYTSIMGKDERLAFEVLNKNRQIQKPIIEQFNGRWVKESVELDSNGSNFWEYGRLQLALRNYDWIIENNYKWGGG